MDRAALLNEVSRRLGRRDLVWAGLRADDIEPLSDLPQTTASFSIIGAYRARQSIDSLAHEDLTGVRVDLDAWDIDEELHTEATREFRQSLLSALARSSAILAYRPSRFLSAVWFARQDRCLNLSLFGAHQAAFEHKPWVESAVADLGLPRVPWTYVADEEQRRALDILREGPVMIRRSRGSGGAGITRIDNPAALTKEWPNDPEAFVSVTPFIDHTVPVNVGATVWADGVTVHRPSVQLIGIGACVTRPFGYCGNDFGAASSLPPAVADQIEQSTISIGMWLRSHGYRGTFGVDYLVHEGQPLFTEVNARFQGSTTASSRLSIHEGEACLLIEHLAAMLGCPAPSARPLRELAATTPSWAQVIVHWTGATAHRLDPAALVAAGARLSRSSRSDVTCRPSLLTEPGGVVARLFARETMTTDGYSLTPAWQHAIGGWVHSQIGVPELERQDEDAEVQR